MRYTILLILLCQLSLQSFGQTKASELRRIARDYRSQNVIDSSLLYYDSAFYGYVGLDHYASASLTYFEMKEILQDTLGTPDTLAYYLKFVYDSTKNTRRYRSDSYILDIQKDLIQHYFDTQQYDSAESVVSTTLTGHIRKHGLRSKVNSGLFRITEFLNYKSASLDSTILWSQRLIDREQDDSLLQILWINRLEYDKISASRSALASLESARDFDGKDKIINLYKVERAYYDQKFQGAQRLFNSISAPDESTPETVKVKYQFLRSLFLFENGEYDQCLSNTREQLTLMLDLLPEPHPLHSDFYVLISRAFYEKSDFGASKDYLERHIGNLERMVANGHPVKTRPFFEYSRVLSSLEYFDQSLILADSALELSAGMGDPIFTAQSLGQKGLVFHYLNELDSADKYLQQAYQLFDKSLTNKDHVHFAKVLNDLGLNFQKKGEDQLAIDNYKKSLGIYRKLLGEVHPKLGEGYYNVGTIYQKNRQFPEALVEYQTSIVTNVFDFEETTISANPSTDNVLSDFILLRSLTGKVEALEFNYRITSDTTFLHIALDTYELIANVIDKLRTGYVSKESKEFLGKKTAYLYESAILTCIEMGKRSGDKSFDQRAFKFSEKSRSGILLSGIKDAQAKKIAGVPDSLLAFEKEVIKAISDKELELFDELNKGNRSNRLKVDELKTEVFKLKNDYNKHVEFLESQYPDYFKLKYDTYTANVQDIQKYVLQPALKRDKKKYELIEYFIGTNSIYIFHIKPDGYELIIREKPDQFENYVSALRNGILYNIPAIFLEHSLMLYDLLLPDETAKKTHYILVPDGVLSYLPFESLLQEQTTKDLNKQRYLLHKATISYTYSATLSVEMTKTPYDYSTDNLSFSGFAPTFKKVNKYHVLSSKADLEVDLLLNDSTELAKSEYAELPGSEEELKEIFKKLDSRGYDTYAYLFNSASKENLLEESSLDSRFLHFATHGILNESNPEFSGIVFADSTRTNLLTIGEIYGMDTNAEVVSLSACQTGLGKLQRGEGLVSFSRGFFFTGSKFIIVSLWAVGDASTSEVMTQFYSKYAKKKRKNIYVSFRKARLKVLKKKEFNKLKDWFPFVLVGAHPTAITESGSKEVGRSD